jgi:hypothetical protein
VSSTQLAYFWCWSQQSMELYLCSPVRLIIVLRIHLGAGTILPESYNWKECLKREHVVCFKITELVTFYFVYSQRQTQQKRTERSTMRKQTLNGSRQRTAGRLFVCPKLSVRYQRIRFRCHVT